MVLSPPARRRMAEVMAAIGAAIILASPRPNRIDRTRATATPTPRAILVVAKAAL
ncbi:hypothetical protein D3C87_2174800 [compost metagenome]